jgi:hypothetical protein
MKVIPAATTHRSMFITHRLFFGWYYFFTAKWSYPDRATYPNGQQKLG